MLGAGSANRLVVLVGGARSGKSSLAQRLAEEAAAHTGSAVTFVATATAGDADMAARIARHQADRPAGWGLVEAPLALTPALAAIDPAATVIVDCLTLWVANLVFAERSDAEVEAEARAVAAALAARPGLSLAVTNEVGLGVHPPTELGRRYQDLLGRVNQAAVAASGRALLVVAGRALPLADPADLVGPEILGARLPGKGRP
ncbi:MAG: bifunctional adenosylcobinamide kinase/adenosylcobinamide-phosphate guanylyltransferase [Acidimicrobiales bacterium]